MADTMDWGLTIAQVDGPKLAFFTEPGTDHANPFIYDELRSVQVAEGEAILHHEGMLAGYVAARRHVAPEPVLVWRKRPMITVDKRHTVVSSRLVIVPKAIADKLMANEDGWYE